MSNMGWVSQLNAGQYNQLNVGAAFANSTTLTDISPGGNNSGQAFIFLGSSLQAGQMFRVRATGIASTSGTPTLSLGLYYGGVAGTALATTGAVATSSGLANQMWVLSADIRINATGPTGSAYAVGQVAGPYASLALMPATSSTGNLVTINTSASSILTIGAQWGTAAAGNTITVYNFIIESLN